MAFWAVSGILDWVMKGKGNQEMGRFAVEFEIANYWDVMKAEHGDLEPGKVRRKTIRGVVDSGASNLVLPQTVVKELGFPVRKNTVKVQYADGRRSRRPEVSDVYLRLQGRESVFNALVEPKRDTALIGAIVLEVLDFLADCKRGRLVPHDPDSVVAVIE